MIRGSLVLLALAIAAPAQEFRLTLPRGAAPGQELEVRCYGRGLSDLTSVLTFREGIDVLEVAADRDDRARLRLRIREDCPLGAHLLMLHTRRGITRAKTFHIGPLPAVACVDGNSTAEKAQHIDLDVTVDGRILSEETDWFAFDAAEGQLVRIEVEGIRLADSDFDPQVEVFDPDGSMLVRGDDSALGRLDPIVSVRCERAGTYRIALRDVAFRGSNYATYRLHVGTFPRPTGMVPAGGVPGEAIAVRLVGGAVAAEATVQLPELPGLHEVFPVVDGTPVPTPVIVAVDRRRCFVEGEEIEDVPSAPCAFHGIVGAQREEDRYAFRARKGQRIDVRVLARNLRSPLDPVLIVRDHKGKALASNDDGLGLDGRLRFTAPSDGTFLVCVRDHLERGGPGYFYRIEVGAVPTTPTTREAIPGRRAEDFGIAVAQGGRAATLIQVTGLDARHGVDLGWHGLPDGVIARGGRLLSGVSTVPMVFEAAADAALAAHVVSPVATAETVPHERVVRHRHAFPLLRVRNAQTYLERSVSQLPVVVTEPCPFSIEVEPPRVPMVRRGSASLRFRLQRDEGFGETVVVRMLWTPPGLSAGTATMRGERTDGTISLNARSTAAVGRWPVVLVASAKVGGVSRTVASALADLEVQEPWIDARLPRIKLEQGASTTMAIELERKREFTGEIVPTLGRLPKGVEARFPAIEADTSRIEVELVASKDAQVGRHRSVYLRLVVRTEEGEIVHIAGSGEIRVDRPLSEEPRGEGGS